MRNQRGNRGVSSRSVQRWATLLLPAYLGLFLLGVGSGLESAVAADSLATDADPGFVHVIEIRDAITPITVEQVTKQIEESERAGARALVIEMDTPGGLESAMRDVVKAILASSVPVITYVHPPGARAASAGLFIVTASHVAAMAPNTNLGAASPVSIGGTADTTLAKKATSDAAALIESLAETRGRNIEWNGRAVREAISAGATEALEKNVIDIVADDVEDLLEQADGRVVKLGEREETLLVAGAEVRRIKTSLRLRILAWLAHPNVAYLLLTLGFYGILFELNSPGAILPGVAGAIFLILGFVAMQTLPVNVAGLLLILLALAFFLLEIKVQSNGILAVGGAVAFLIGSLILFDPGLGGVFRVSLAVILGVTIATVGFFFFVIAKAIGAQRRRISTGSESLVGERGEAISDLQPQGEVRVHGEIWRAKSSDPVIAGAEVEVVRVDGLRLEVRPIPKEGV